MDRICRQKDGQNGSSHFEWTENGEQKRKFLLVRRMEFEIPSKVQMASFDWKISPLIKTKEGTSESGVRNVKKSRWFLLWENGKEQTN